LNTYGYVGGNPLYWYDSLGLAPDDANKIYVPSPVYIPPRYAPDGTEITYTWNTPDSSAVISFSKCILYGMCSESNNGDESKKESCPSNDRYNWEKIPRSRPPAYRPKGKKEPVFQGDSAGDRSHAGSKWKKWDKYRDWAEGKPRNGTYDAKGRRLRN